MTRIEGMNVAAITPRRDGEADVAAVLEVIDWLCGAGVRGIALLGSTGEFANLSFDERKRLTYLATKRSRVPVLAGVAHTSLDGAVELGREACAAGVAGLLIMPPYFFRYAQDDIREFYLEFARQMGGSVPLYLYNIPFFTTEIAVETALELLEGGQYAGIKDSSGRMEYMTRLLASPARASFTVLAGNDIIFRPARLAGADGGVSGVASALPELMLALDRAVTSGDQEWAGRLETRLNEFITWIDKFPTPALVKLATGLRGLKAGPLSVPLSPARRKTLGEFEEWFQPWLAQVLKDARHA